MSAQFSRSLQCCSGLSPRYAVQWLPRHLAGVRFIVYRVLLGGRSTRVVNTFANFWFFPVPCSSFLWFYGQKSVTIFSPFGHILPISPWTHVGRHKMRTEREGKSSPFLGITAPLIGDKGSPLWEFKAPEGLHHHCYCCGTITNTKLPRERGKEGRERRNRKTGSSHICSECYEAPFPLP